MKNHYEMFKEDLEQGQKDENYIIPYILEHFKAELVDTNKDNKWDYRIKLQNGQVLSFEQKSDWVCVPPRFLGEKLIRGKDTGNMAVEYECFDKPSGISVSKADFFVYWYRFLGLVYIVPVSEVRWLMFNYDFPCEKMGKGFKAKGQLVPRSMLDNPIVLENIYALE
jgi:hypothetical protein